MAGYWISFKSIDKISQDMSKKICFLKQLWPWIKIKVIQTGIKGYSIVMHII